MNKIIPADVLRKRAWNALKPIFPIALLVSLCAMLPSLLGQVAVTRFADPLIEAVNAIQADSAMTPTAQLAMLDKAVTPQLTIALVVLVVVTLLCAFLRLGRYHFLLKTLRGEEGSPADLLTCAPLFLKAMGQQLYTGLLTFLWALPGLAVTLLGAAIVLLAPAKETLSLMMFLYYVGTGVSVVLTIRATMHYCLAPIILADHPETGILASVRQSLDIMRHRKMLYFILLISFIGWILLVNIVQSLFTALVPLMGMTIGMALDLALALYQDTAVVAFYEAYRPGADQPQFVDLDPTQDLNS